MTQSLPTRFRRRLPRGFSLVEVMLAVFIFAVGLIMVITIFPVGADWTRQATESTIAQEVAQNALGIIQSHYPLSSPLTGVTIPPAATGTYSPLMPFPGCYPNPGYTIPSSEMCYQFGAASPCPADPAKATYFWTAFIRATPTALTNLPQGTFIVTPVGVTEPTGLTVKYDVFILVFKKGTPSQVWTVTGNPNISPNPTPLPQVQNPTGNYATYKVGVYDATAATWTTQPYPALGEYGVGLWSGTVFRQQLQPTQNLGVPATKTMPMPGLMGCNGQPDDEFEPVILGKPADGTTASPLIYVFQTTLAWKRPLPASP